MQGGVDAGAQGLQGLELRELLILGVDDIPGGAGGVGVPQVAVEGLQALVVVLILPQVPVPYPPGGVLAGQQPVDALLLLLLADVEEELQHQVAVVGKAPLEPLYAVYPLDVLLVVQAAVQPLLHDLIHPAGIQKRELPGLGDLLEEPVEEGLAPLLLRGGGGHGEHLEEPGVDVPDDLADGAALARGAPALDEHQHRQLLVLQQHLLGLQLLLGRVQALLQFLFFGFFRVVPIFQHGHLLLACGGQRPVINRLVLL